MITGKGLKSRLVLLGVAAAAVVPATAHAASVRFTAPLFVDKTLAGGEPSNAYATKSGLLVYTSHEGTTHLFSSAIPGAPAESGGFIVNYHNQVNIWTSADQGKTWQLVPFGTATNPFATGFSDPDLTQDSAGNIYNTGIDLANDALFSSQDGGRTWPTGTPQCHEGDRPWLAGGKAERGVPLDRHRRSRARDLPQHRRGRVVRPERDPRPRQPRPTAAPTRGRASSTTTARAGTWSSPSTTTTRTGSSTGSESASWATRATRSATPRPRLPTSTSRRPPRSRTGRRWRSTRRATTTSSGTPTPATRTRPTAARRPTPAARASGACLPRTPRPRWRTRS